jgi:hypothetical protein
MLTTLFEYRGSNVLRTITGGLLGYGYGVGLALLVLESNLFALVIGAGYGVIAASLVYIHTSG